MLNKVACTQENTEEAELWLHGRDEEHGEDLQCRHQHEKERDAKIARSLKFCHHPHRDGDVRAKGMGHTTKCSAAPRLARTTLTPPLVDPEQPR